LLWPVVAVVIAAQWQQLKGPLRGRLSKNWHHIVLVGIAAVLGYYAVAGPWLLRNKLTFGRWFLTHRAKQVQRRWQSRAI
jgi:hypothetical protein